MRQRQVGGGRDPVIKSKRILVLLLCVSFPYLKTSTDRSTTHGVISAMDFGVVYYGARCVMEHQDPYHPETALRELEADGGKFTAADTESGRLARKVVSRIIYPPTAFLAVAPLAMLRWPVALAVWMALMAGWLAIAAFLMWELAGGAPKIAGCLAGFMLLNCVLLMWFGNPAGIVTSLCVMAAWCFLKDRFAPAGVAMLTVALMIKPHDAGFVWLYFLLAGGVGRKRALQTLAATAVLGFGAAVWIAPVSPHWMGELRSNMAVLSARGGPVDPGPAGMIARGTVPNISLQSDLSVLKDDPHFYNAASYAFGGVLILIWAIAVLRKRFSKEGALFSLAAISVLTVLPVYHRTYDAKLLLLTIPACAMLWAGGGARRWWALGLTSAAIVVTSDIPLIFLSFITGNIAISPNTLGGKLTLLALQPAPLVLLAAGCFYLWVYIRYKPEMAGDGERVELAAKPVAAGD